MSHGKGCNGERRRPQGRLNAGAFRLGVGTELLQWLHELRTGICLQFPLSLLVDYQDNRCPSTPILRSSHQPCPIISSDTISLQCCHTGNFLKKPSPAFGVRLIPRLLLGPPFPLVVQVSVSIILDIGGLSQSTKASLQVLTPWAATYKKPKQSLHIRRW